MADLNNSLLRIIEKFKNAFNISTILPGSKLYQLAESIAYESATSESMLEDFVLKNSLMSASTFNLDTIGKNFFGLERIKNSNTVITASMKVLKFYTNNSVTFGNLNKTADGLLQDIIIPEGTVISGMYNQMEYSYKIKKQVILGKNTSIAYIDATQISGDNKIIPANILKEHNFYNYTANGSKSLLVTNAYSIGVGAQEETDNNYRNRLVTSLQSKSSSSYFGIRNEILAIPEVANVEIVNGAWGGGSLAVYIQGMTPITSDELIAKVYDVVSILVPAWATFTVNKFRYYGLTMSLRLNSGALVLSEAAKQAVYNNIVEYVNNFYGNDFRIKSLLQIANSSSPEILNASLETVEIYTGSTDYRVYSLANLSNPDPYIFLNTIDKLILEPTPSPIVFLV
jgi:hypothetical protein